MARVCAYCIKKTTTGKNRSHSNKATKRTFKPNLITKNIDLGDGLKVKVKLCSGCYKKLFLQG